MQTTKVRSTFAKHLSLQIVISPVKMPPVHKVWSWSLWAVDGGDQGQADEQCIADEEHPGDHPLR